MKNKVILFATVLISCFLLVGCGQNEQVKKEPDIVQIRSICNLATLECYYHNVAKYRKEADSWLKKDRVFWIEYTGIAKIGIDISKVNITVNEKNVTITMPPAKLLDIDICETDFNKDSYITNEDGFIKNKITAEEQSKAINSAQLSMAESVEKNKSLMQNAQNHAQELIKNYIIKIGETSNINYEIKWVYDDYDESSAKEQDKA